MNNEKRKIAELLHLYRIFEKYGIEIEDIYDMGNLAILIDYYVDNDKYGAIKDEIIKWFSMGYLSNPIFIVVNAISVIANERNYENSELIEEKVEGIKERYYNKEIIDDFTVITSGKYFPEWFLNVYDCIEFEDKEELYNNLMNIINYYPTIREMFSKEINIINFRYYIHKCIEVDDNVFHNKAIMQLLNHITMEDRNKLSWLIFDSSHKPFLSDLYSLRNTNHKMRDKVDAIIRGASMNYRVCNNLYKKKELFFFINIPVELINEFTVEL